MKLVIDRRIWLRGEGSDVSYLLRGSDKKQCCVGILCESLGVSKKNLQDHKGSQTLSGFNLPEWLTPESDDLFKAYEINDTSVPANVEVAAFEASREAKITELFAEHDIQVEFVDRKNF
jgi:hypothetical protein